MQLLSILTAALTLTASALAIPGQSRNKCPPRNFDAVTDFSLPAYLGQWYIQAQMPTQGLPATWNHCTTAVYTQSSESTISVFNFVRIGAVDGPAQQTTPNLKGTIRDASRPSKVSVGPEFLPGFLGGPYWVVATGPIVNGEYQWSIVSGGAPNQESNGKCVANSPFAQIIQVPNGQGLWIFTRERLPGADAIKALRSKMVELGLDETLALPVKHEGCTYF
ncbi:Calycin-like protein [Chytridium lagenaria]|nr:Calycin-like protein [Chytridium lagenaria]